MSPGGGQVLGPKYDLPELAISEPVLTELGDQAGGTFEVGRLQGVSDGFFRITSLLKPAAGAFMNQHFLTRIFPPPLLLQQVGEEMMISIPSPLVVQRNEENIRLFQLFQDLL